MPFRFALRVARTTEKSPTPSVRSNRSNRSIRSTRSTPSGIVFAEYDDDLEDDVFYSKKELDLRRTSSQTSRKSKTSHQQRTIDQFPRSFDKSGSPKFLQRSMFAHVPPSIYFGYAHETSKWQIEVARRAGRTLFELGTHWL